MSQPAPELVQRTLPLLGHEAVGRLSCCHVAVVGVGGVGAYAAEMLARTAVGHITLIDGDSVSPSNLNRQLPALVSTIGRPKVDVMSQRITDINPSACVDALNTFITPESVDGIMTRMAPDFVIDAIDSIQPKVTLAAWCIHNNVRIISSMGAGGRIDPARVAYADISETAYDGLAREIRRRLRRDFGIYKGLPVVYSTEPPRRSALVMTDEIAYKASSYGTVAWIPAQFGMMAAAYAIEQLTVLKK
ncbi:tRNA threonylcarbamoyladenosine dehydratase [uncultured Muribaculum sp.]|uniref:tRNA threonylcarbamoyladenosine dehydratase n=1 Tax=uncultured Muribaculum sp. TaxID=1918613 RepID=UPI0025B738FB|nr:tRNA threonylcarbamoyladenosine dehydratase [uncultured Muribaculum sp.]